MTIIDVLANEVSGLIDVVILIGIMAAFYGLVALAFSGYLHVTDLIGKLFRTTYTNGITIMVGVQFLVVAIVTFSK